MKKILTIILISLCFTAYFTNSAIAAKNSFTVGNGSFLLNGKPFIVKAAELHYARIPQPYWEHRIKMCKALGMNTICIYIFWNKHEQQEGVFDWSGENDVAAFCRLCQKHGMYVIVRPGPYVCAEWEMGGLPWWLLKKKDIVLRDLDTYFMERVKIFESEVGKQLAPLTIQNGGPIIMVQVENEYGSYATNKPYVSAIRDCLRSVGFDNTVLFQCDWSSNFEKNALPDLLWTMNFGTNAKVLDQFKKVRSLRPDTPLMCSEYWSGWFDGWGSAHQTRPANAMVQGIQTMLENNISFSLYMTHGGTSFGQWAGANNTGFAPDCTSYDYDAPINEQGSATEKYYELRTLLQKYSASALPSVPKPLPVIEISDFICNEISPLLSPENLPAAIHSNDIQPIEQFNQGYGSIMYSTTLPATRTGDLLEINDVCDYAIVYINGKCIGRLYRGNKEDKTLRITESYPAGASLDIFVEAMGRINYSKLIKDSKGITSNVLLHTTNGKDDITYNLHDWAVRLFPIDDYTRERKWTNDSLSISYPAYYRGHFSVTKLGDTFLDMSSWGKGLVWVNGHCLGRYWQVGPQQSLYLPGCWLKRGNNEVIILDIIGTSHPHLRGLTTPINDILQRHLLPHDASSVLTSSPHSLSRTDNIIGNDAAPGAK